MWASTLSQHYQQRTSLEMWFKHQYRRIASDVCWSDFRNHSSSPWLFPDSDYSLFRCKSLSSFIKRSSFEFLTFFLQMSVIIGNFCNDASHIILTLLKFLTSFRFEFPAKLSDLTFASFSGTKFSTHAPCTTVTTRATTCRSRCPSRRTFTTRRSSAPT